MGYKDEADFLKSLTRPAPFYSGPAEPVFWSYVMERTSRAPEAMQLAGYKGLEPLGSYLWQFQRVKLSAVDVRNHWGISLMAGSIEARRVQEIIDEIKNTGRYYPPIVGPNLEVLDGMHTMVALHQLYGPGFKIYLWRALG
jgi:hypothetical protein